MARKVAGQAARSGRRTSLEPMNPYERRIIHTAVQDVEGAISWSVGSEPNRHVMIGPSDDNPMKDKPQSSETRGRSSQGRGHRGGKPSGGGRNGESRPPRGERPERAPRTDGASRSDVAPERPARQVRQFIPRSNPLPVADGATPPSKTPSEAESSASLYGRIDL